MDKREHNAREIHKRPTYLFVVIAILLVSIAIGVCIYVVLDKPTDQKELGEMPSISDNTADTVSSIMDGLKRDPIISRYIKVKAVLSIELLERDADISELTTIRGNIVDAKVIDKGRLLKTFKDMMADPRPEIAYDGTSFRVELRDDSDDPVDAAASAVINLRELSPSTAGVHLDIEKEIASLVKEDAGNDTYGTMLITLTTNIPNAVLVGAVSLDPGNSKCRIYLDGSSWMQVRAGTKIDDFMKYDRGLGIMTFELRNKIVADSNIDQCLDAFIAQFAY